MVREHGKMARTPLAAFFNIPMIEGKRLSPPNEGGGSDEAGYS
jgi:hypothetical protein